MCPSFQATRDEKDSTRGRANLLRLAITGQLGFEGFTDPHLHRGARPLPRVQGVQERVPDQCGHGPAQGGVSRISTYRKHGVPWRNRVFGHVAALGRIGLRAGTRVELGGASRLAPLVEREAPGNRPPAPCPLRSRRPRSNSLPER